MQADGKFLGVGRYSMTTVFFIRKDIMEAKGLKVPKVYDPDVVEFAKKAQDPAKDLFGFGQTLNRSDDGDGFMSNILWDYGGGVWDKDGKPALGTSFLKQNTAALQFAVDTIKKHGIQPPGVMGWTDVSNNEAYMAGKLVTTNNGASLYFAMVSKKHELRREDALRAHAGWPRRILRRLVLLQLGHLPEVAEAELWPRISSATSRTRSGSRSTCRSRWGRRARCTRAARTIRTGSRIRTSTR